MTAVATNWTSSNPAVLTVNGQPGSRPVFHL